MLLNYSIENYKSIKEKETISFLAKPLKQHKGHLLNKKILPVIALYGPNGGGKTAILESIKECKELIYGKKMFGIPNNQFFENFKNNKLNPIKWEFIFLDDANRELIYNIHFLNEIIFEEFKVIDHSISSNNETVIFRKDNSLKNDNVYFFGKELENMKINLSIFNNRKSLLLTFSNFFKIELIENLSKEFKKIIWIDNTFPINKTLNPFEIPIFNIGDINLIIENKSIILNIFKDLEININDIKIEIHPLIPNSHNVFLGKKNLYDEEYWINYIDESNGTQKIIILLALFIKGIHNKNMFIIDELDSGIHTKILKYLILMFTQNNKGAQLIFSSHDMPTLTSSIFRKDEIYFAAINDSKFTSIISLWEFGSDVREAHNFAKTYLDGKLGYDPYVDYSLKGFKKKNG